MIHLFSVVKGIDDTHFCTYKTVKVEKQRFYYINIPQKNARGRSGFALIAD